ncbi:MAG: FAD-binding protein [Planctomycetes bacterium]|nr:FAD-binding protein [Planctomycetota bacterium]
MNAPSHQSTLSHCAEPLEKRLRRRVRGDVRYDKLSRTIYATDASIYEIVPVGVVLPKSVDDVVAVIDECRAEGTPIIPRGAGTGLTGGAVGSGLQLDLSRYMNRIGAINTDTRTIDVEAGVVLDELNAHVALYGLHFAPDLATSSRATIGGMIANNSCGARSIVHGRTVDHVLSLTMVLADGTVVTFGAAGTGSGAEKIERGLARIRDDNFDEIGRRFPQILRSSGGYGLDRLGSPGEPINAVNILCGSEGTLGVVVGATLRLTPLPRHTGLIVLHFRDVLQALGATPAILSHRPTAVELVDRLIIEAGLANPVVAKQCGFLSGNPGALLIVELQDERADSLRTRMEPLAHQMESADGCYAVVRVPDSVGQLGVWNLRTAGLGLLMSKPGDEQPYAFVEDSAVDPTRLQEYIQRFTAILDREGVTAGYYAHASVGCIHVRPVINLKQADDVERIRRIAEAVCDLALEFGGAMTGEHGDGIVRSCWIEKMYGPRIVNAFRDVKRLFDPDNLMNPHKIVDPWPMTEHLRFGPSHRQHEVKTAFDFTGHGGMAGLAQMCSGVGQCRQTLVGTMCPSFVATGDERHTTRARANALRIALSNRGLLDGLSDPHLGEVMDLCIGCKACKTECPTGVDMARLKSEYLFQRNLARGAGRRERFIADLPQRLARASRWPRLFNAASQSKLLRGVVERRYGLDRRIAPPRLAHRTFRHWFRRHQKRRGDVNAPRGDVVFFVDTWTNHLNPEIGMAAVRLMEAAGFNVLCPTTLCCGRPAISQGLLTEAKQLAESNIRKLARFAGAGTPIVGVEPSCILTLVDDYPSLFRFNAARRVAGQSMMIESFLRRLLDENPNAIRFDPPETSLLYHAHCHQKALVGSGDGVALLRYAFGDAVSEIDSGCCGMAGAFGHEVEHYETARAIGEHRLFPAVRDRGEAAIAVSGHSCSVQIDHHTHVRPRHVVEYLADALVE